MLGHHGKSSTCGALLLHQHRSRHQLVPTRSNGRDLTAPTDVVGIRLLFDREVGFKLRRFQKSQRALISGPYESIISGFCCRRKPWLEVEEEEEEEGEDPTTMAARTRATMAEEEEGQDHLRPCSLMEDFYLIGP